MMNALQNSSHQASQNITTLRQRINLRNELRRLAVQNGTGSMGRSLNRNSSPGANKSFVNLSSN